MQLTIQPRSYVFVDSSERLCDERSLKQGGALLSNECNGLTIAVRRQIKKIVQCWVSTAHFSIALQPAAPFFERLRIGHITLTIPDAIRIDHRKVKREGLEIFMQWLKYQAPELLWFWRLEKQRRGTPHFHLLVNKYFPAEKVRKEWWRICSRNGWTKKYRNKYPGHIANLTDVREIDLADRKRAYQATDFGKEHQSEGLQGRIWGAHQVLKELDYPKMFLSMHNPFSLPPLHELSGWSPPDYDSVKVIDRKQMSAYKSFVNATRQFEASHFQAVHNPVRHHVGL